jgi:hypothetical protein
LEVQVKRENDLTEMSSFLQIIKNTYFVSHVKK